MKPPILQSSSSCTSAYAIEGLLTVCFPDARTILDTTYGNGQFWVASRRTVWGSDRDPARARHVVARYEALPFGPAAVDVVVFDPPFLPETRNGAGKYGRRFTKVRDESGGFGIGAVQALRFSVLSGLQEARRVARLGVIIKVQDTIHSRRPIWMSMWLWEACGEPYDFLTVRAKSKMQAISWQRQLSVRRNHTTYWVYRVDSPGNYHVVRRSRSRA